MIESINEMKSSTPLKNNKKVNFRLTTSDILWLLLARTQHIVSKIRHKELRECGVTINEAAVLLTVLRINRPATPAAISQEVHWEPHTVSELLKVMEKKGTIKKVRDLERKNLIRVEITDKGIEAFRKLSQRKSTRKVMSVLTKEEQIQLWTLLAKIRDKGVEQLGLRIIDIFPPSNPREFKD
jgi:MarR family transcriptional regulator, multiple antibiotic resistance protein MarR